MDTRCPSWSISDEARFPPDVWTFCDLLFPEKDGADDRKDASRVSETIGNVTIERLVRQESWTGKRTKKRWYREMQTEPLVRESAIQGLPDSTAYVMSANGVVRVRFPQFEPAWREPGRIPRPIESFVAVPREPQAAPSAPAPSCTAPQSSTDSAVAGDAGTTSAQPVNAVSHPRVESEGRRPS